MSEDPIQVADLHSHLVPAVDDGARTVEDVLDGVGRMSAAGIRRIVTTPHVDASLVRDPLALAARMEALDRGWDTALGAVSDAFPHVDFRRGAEVRLDVPDPSFEDARLRLAGTSFVLVEWAGMRVPPRSEEVLARIRGDGWRPILAHPERYGGVSTSTDLPRRWREVGAYLQVNYGSLLGGHGTTARRVAFGLLEEGSVDYLSSDFHGRPEAPLHREEAADRLAGLGAEDVLDRLSVVNTGRVLEDREPLPPLPLPQTGMLRRTLDRLGSRSR